MTEARELNHAYVGTEHLLLGLIREEKGLAARVPGESGIELEEARDETLRFLGVDPEDPSLPRPPERLSATLPLVKHTQPLGGESDRLRWIGAGAIIILAVTSLSVVAVWMPRRGAWFEVLRVRLIAITLLAAGLALGVLRSSRGS